MGEAKIVIRKNTKTLTLQDKKKKRKMKRWRGKRNDYDTIIKRGLQPEYNFLKYWRVVRKWALAKYDISQEELEMLLYLYDEDLFTRDMFVEFEGLLTWDKKRFSDMQKKGWIIVWRPNNGYKSKKLYTLSVGAKRMCSSVYKKLTQDEHIPENRQNNPIFRGNSYSDRMYRKMIRKMNQKREEGLAKIEE